VVRAKAERLVDQPGARHDEQRGAAAASPRQPR
jgi:hypothetical protein